MEYVYAAMLLHKAGRPINEENVSKVLEAAGINADPVRVKALVASISAVDIDEVGFSIHACGSNARCTSPCCRGEA